MKDLAIYGAGSFGHEVTCIINQLNKSNQAWNMVGFYDDKKEKGFDTGFGIVLGGINELNLRNDPINVVIAIGDPGVLQYIVSQISNPKVNFPNIIAPGVFFYDRSSVKMGKGNLIGPNSSISCNVSLGDFNMLNVFTQVGHDTSIGNFNVVMPSVNISGCVEVGNGNLFAVKSTIIQNIKIGNGVTLAPNSVMTRNAKDGKSYLGNPAKVFI
jgi:sugar O-acyltransferase (sialic acid O-acetyltransferase NeuD family)